jgi:HEAT repeat protein
MFLAVLFLLQVGSPPVDTLLKELRSDDADLRSRATADLLAGWRTWKDEDLIQIEAAARDQDPEVRGRAGEIRSRIRVRRAVGEKLLRQIPKADDAFVQGDDAAKIAVLQSAKDAWKSGTLPEGSLKGLESLASRAPWADPANLDRFLNDPDTQRIFSLPGDTDSRALVRSKEVEALGKLGEKHSGDVAEYLADVAPEVRTSALKAIGGMQARDQAPKVAALLKDRNDGVRREALSLLGSWEAKQYTGDFALLLDDPAVGVRRRAAEVLLAWGRKDAVPQFALLLKDPFAPSRADAALALGVLGARELAPKLVPLLSDPHAMVRRNAADSLGRLGAVEFGRPLTESLQDRDAGVRWAVVHSLGEFGPCPPADEVVPLLRDADPEVRTEAAWVAGFTGSKDAARRLAQLLDDADGDVRQGAVRALGLRRDPEFRGAVTARLADRAEWVRWEAVLALGRIGTSDDATNIAALLRDPKRKVRVNAALALGMLGRGDPDGVLAALEKNEDRLLGLAATLSLVRLGMAGRPALAVALREIAANDLAFACLAEAASDAASFVHSREAWDLLNRPLPGRRSIETWPDLSSALLDAGLTLQVQTDCAIGRLDKSHQLTGRESVRFLVGHFAAPAMILDGRKVRLMSPRDGLAYGQKLLDGK